MKIAITGGCGYLGSKLVKRLIKTGHEILIIENFSTSVNDDLNDCKIVECDITNPQDLAKVKAKNYDVLLHLAAQSSGPKSFDIPDVDIKINILGTLNMINWCRDNDINRILFASSFVIYGDNINTEILSESEVCNPQSIYALSKYASEKLLKIYAEPLGIKWNALRMFNVYGPGQDLSRNDQGMVSIFLNIIRNGNYVGVQGSLDRFRDFIYIDDVLQGWERCLYNDQFPNEAYNLGSGVKTSLSFLISSLAEVYEKKNVVKVEELSSTPGDIMGCYADISKISKQLGYEPEFDLEKGIEHFKLWADQEP